MLNFACRFEPWGVVIHEAAAAGLPIIASHLCGATTAYVRDGVNGFIISPTVENLTQAMSLITELGIKNWQKWEMRVPDWRIFGAPEKLSDYFYSTVKRRCKDRIFCWPS